ncbi:hypothetical protein [Sulfuriferula nivalis]|jgi:hypothetical protein|uniref:Crp/Fnr family transcriptional regulator n=1 Tax=Sulfuriferula nivalis TaxID=2675298 RepID=A0A809S1L3_9PROT|nr:hypothetical protein [Sulfuriferula nivalis]BBP00468.1 hypothetical protein SFSGTM_11760 [Sulfuriferula nivalis]
MVATEKDLLKHFRALDPVQQQSALDYLAFLASRPSQLAAVDLPQPVDIPRPEEESVVKAIKRLRATYPMLEPNKLLNDTSNQMTRHMLHSVPAVEVVDELERVFRQHYETYIAKFNTCT